MAILAADVPVVWLACRAGDSLPLPRSHDVDKPPCGDSGRVPVAGRSGQLLGIVRNAATASVDRRPHVGTGHEGAAWK